LADSLRRLTTAGSSAFSSYLKLLRMQPDAKLPLHLLQHAELSEEVSGGIELAPQVFANRYELGVWLVEALTPLDRRLISYDHGMWNWLALYFFDTICPADAAGKRKVLRDELYLLGSTYDYLRYYKHLVRTPWLAVLEHGSNAQVLFRNARGVRSDIEETLAASQQVLGDRTIMEAACRLYFDMGTGKPKSGASGKAAGSPRRLTAIVQQLALTYDLPSCTPEQFISMLPAEFDRFRA
jgi:hypothetical protein